MFPILLVGLVEFPRGLTKKQDINHQGTIGLKSLVGIVDILKCWHLPKKTTSYIFTDYNQPLQGSL